MIVTAIDGDGELEGVDFGVLASMMSFAFASTDMMRIAPEEMISAAYPFHGHSMIVITTSYHM